MKPKDSLLVHNALPEMLPVVPTMDIVVFPNQIVPLLVLDERIIKGINTAVEEEHKLVLLLASKKQSDTHQGIIGTKDLYDIGTIASIMRVIKVPDGGIKILVQGVSRAFVHDIVAEENVLHADIEQIFYEEEESHTELLAQIKNIKDIAETISMSGHALSTDFHIILSKMNDPEKIADFILSHLNLRVDQAQRLLECRTHRALLEELYTHLSKEFEVSEMQENIKNRARESMNQSQKEFYLREQLRAIKKELGEDDTDEVDQLRSKIGKLDLPDEVRIEVNRQLNRLEKSSPDSMESAVTRGYLEWIAGLPWGVETTDNLDILEAKKILDEDHYGLSEIKERILDFISIKHLKNDGYSPILCLAGPPGTGKTSLGKSIARSLGRNFFRISLGGVRDEAEIRGHRRTYVGAMPGRFLQGIRRAGSLNPVIIIDELDKIGADFRGDPSAAMLEVLDPNQNKAFYDNYLGVPFDLSRVMFIATANNVDSISEPLRDRMEVINLAGYTLEEKIKIGHDYLIKKSMHESGLETKPLIISDELLGEIIKSYTREAGVRELERLLKKLCSKAARSLVEKNEPITVDIDNIEQYLGPRKFVQMEHSGENQVGICNGLAWTSCGGEIIKVEAVIMPGKGKLTLTGSLGNVMQESARAALSYARAHALEFDIDPKMFTQYDLHIHVPGGAIPKDGPSAGVTLLSSILSALTGRAINAAYAMTGELNLRGNVMPIGGVKEKILAAKRNALSHVILPDQNKNDLIGAEEIASGIEVIWVKHANEILSRVLMPVPKKDVGPH